MPSTTSSKSLPKCISKPSNRKVQRRSRTTYTSEQLHAMEMFFSTDQYPDFNSRIALADAIALSEARVQVGLKVE